MIIKCLRKHRSTSSRVMHTARVGLHFKYPRKFNAAPLIHLRAFNADTLFKATSWELIRETETILSRTLKHRREPIQRYDEKTNDIDCVYVCSRNAMRRKGTFGFIISPFFSSYDCGKIAPGVLYRRAYIFAQRRDSIKMPCQIVKEDAIKVVL